MEKTNNSELRKAPIVNAIQHGQKAIQRGDIKVAIQHESRLDNIPRMPAIKAQAHQKGA